MNLSIFLFLLISYQINIAITLIFSKEYTHFEDVYFVNQIKLKIGMITMNIDIH